VKTFAILSMLAALPLVAQTIDLSKPPVSREAKAYKLPPVFETKLPNGLTVMLAEDARFFWRATSATRRTFPVWRPAWPLC
jgi:hypothetical protein